MAAEEPGSLLCPPVLPGYADAPLQLLSGTSGRLLCASVRDDLLYSLKRAPLCIFRWMPCHT